MHALDGWWMNEGEGVNGWMDEDGVTTFLWVLFFPSSSSLSVSLSLFFSFSLLLSCLVRCCACLLLSPLLFCQLLHCRCLSRRPGTSILCGFFFFFFKSGAQKTAAFAEFVCVQKQARKKRCELWIAYNPFVVLLFSCLFVAFVASVVGLLSCVLFWVWVCSLIEM